VNKSVFGSLFYDEDYNFKYSILNSNKPESLKVLYEDDVIGYDVITKNRIINRAKINYKYHTDLVTGEVTTDSLTMTSEFVDKLIKFSKEEILDTYLFNESDAQVILERFLFFNSLTNSIVRIKGKLNLASLNLNDVVKLELDRIYRRYSGGDRTKLGLINFLEKDENSCTIQVNDLGGIFNRVPSIAPDTLSDFSGSTPDSIAKYGYIVDNLTETPSNDETYLGSNLIG
jgi:hypothetical protein